VVGVCHVSFGLAKPKVTRATIKVGAMPYIRGENSRYNPCFSPYRNLADHSLRIGIVGRVPDE
jgi:hypothetical protein